MFKEIKLFYWRHSEAFRDAYPGHIFVLAENVDQARQIAEQSFLKSATKSVTLEEVKRSHQYLLLIEDLKKEPDIYEYPHVIFIMGSA